jgi:hypothetical protein
MLLWNAMKNAVFVPSAGLQYSLDIRQYFC